jgi:hypothetical protein
LRALDKGYLAIFDIEARLPSASLTSTERIAGIFDALNECVAEVERDIERAQAKSAVVSFDRIVEDPDGHKYDPGAVYYGLTLAAGDVVLMQAWREGYFDPDGAVELPVLGKAPPGASNLVKGNLANAKVWREWKGVDERVRFLGGELRELSSPFPDWVPEASDGQPSITLAFEFEPSLEAELFDVLATERLDQRFMQNLGEMMRQTNMLARVAAQGATVPLPPEGLLSVDEAHAGVMLSQALTLPLRETRAGKLSLAEHLRGYATLKQYAAALAKAQGTHFAVVGSEMLLAELTRCGLSAEAATEFISRATFKRSSRDLYDQPLIRLQDGTFIVFGFSLLHADLSKTLLSSLSNEKLSFQGRGKPFEQSTIDLLRRNGFDARTLKVRRGPDKAEYDYDVTFVWGDYVFFIECKNRSIPHGNPVAMFNFNNELKSHRSQVDRLMRGLTEFPDILTKDYPAAVGKMPVFCVLNSLPYSLGLSDGIYFIDESLLGRFFKSGSFGFVVSPLRPPADDEPILRSEVHRVWSGDRPTVEDFIRYIGSPPQLAIAVASYSTSARAVWLSDRVILKLGTLARRDLSPEEVADVLARTRASDEQPDD